MHFCFPLSEEHAWESKLFQPCAIGRLVPTRDQTHAAGVRDVEISKVMLCHHVEKYGDGKGVFVVFFSLLCITQSNCKELESREPTSNLWDSRDKDPMELQAHISHQIKHFKIFQNLKCRGLGFG